MVIGDKLIKTTEKIKSVELAKPSEVVGVFQSAGTRARGAGDPGGAHGV